MHGSDSILIRGTNCSAHRFLTYATTKLRRGSGHTGTPERATRLAPRRCLKATCWCDPRPPHNHTRTARSPILFLLITAPILCTCIRPEERGQPVLPRSSGNQTARERSKKYVRAWGGQCACDRLSSQVAVAPPHRAFARWAHAATLTRRKPSTSGRPPCRSPTSSPRSPCPQPCRAPP